MYILIYIYHTFSLAVQSYEAGGPRDWKLLISVQFIFFSKNKIVHDMAKNGSYGGIMTTSWTAITWRLILYGQIRSIYAKNAQI